MELHPDCVRAGLALEYTERDQSGRCCRAIDRQSDGRRVEARSNRTWRDTASRFGRCPAATHFYGIREAPTEWSHGERIGSQRTRFDGHFADRTGQGEIRSCATQPHDLGTVRRTVANRQAASTSSSSGRGKCNADNAG